jgi:hypothetical protein
LDQAPSSSGGSLAGATDVTSGNLNQPGSTVAAAGIMRAWLERRTSTTLRREVSFRINNEDIRTIWWDFDGEGLPSTLQRDDVVPASLIFQAMHRGVNLHVEGRVSRDLLDRLDTFQDVWTLWRPDLYRKIAVTATQEVDVPRRDPARIDSAVCAFSGGVDGTATAWRHHSGAAGRNSRKLKAGVLIAGFDIPLAATDAWDVVSKNAAAAMADIGVPLCRVRTNWRAAVCVDWEMEYTVGVTSCLRHWEDDVGALLMGSAEEYTRLITPWGSHPLPMMYLAGQDTTIVYDGGEMSRTAKVGLISQWPVAYDALRVCWQGEVTGLNCGVCEKCIRTKLNAIAAGVREPRALAGRPTLADLRAIRRLNGAQEALMQEIVAVAADNGVDDPLMAAAAQVITRVRRRRKAAALKRLIKSLIPSKQSA